MPRKVTLINTPTTESIFTNNLAAKPPTTPIHWSIHPIIIFERLDNRKIFILTLFQMEDTLCLRQIPLFLVGASENLKKWNFQRLPKTYQGFWIKGKLFQKFGNGVYLINVQILTTKVKFTGYSVIHSTKDTFMACQKIFISRSQLGISCQFTDFPVISKFPKNINFKKSGILRGIHSPVMRV